MADKCKSGADISVNYDDSNEYNSEVESTFDDSDPDPKYVQGGSFLRLLWANYRKYCCGLLHYCILL